MTKGTAMSNIDRIAEFAQGVMERGLPYEALDAAQFCITDWLAVALGASSLEPVRALRSVVAGWGTAGRAPVLLGEDAAPAPAALVNGTMAHCLDFDDTHVGSIAHISGPTFAAALAVGAQRGASAEQVVRAFAAGFEAAARLGGDGLGIAINQRHIHSTGIVGCFGAAVAAAALSGATKDQFADTLGLAATQAAGLTHSFGTPAKPFHAGKAALNGVLACEMALAGFHGATDLLEPGGGLAKALVQDGSVTSGAIRFDDGWELTRNTFKPYASCLLTHPVIDAARDLRTRLGNRSAEAITVFVEPMAVQLAGKASPRTPYEGKFSLAFCTALGLSGHLASWTDFTPANLDDPAMQDLARRVELVCVPEMARTAARLEVVTGDGERLVAETALARGNPGRPMSWNELEAKFASLVDPLAGAQAPLLFTTIRTLGAEGTMTGLLAALAELRSGAAGAKQAA
jgi:2-methylcitrate dehydratase PrpD